MSQSAKLASAAYILAYVARHEPEQVTTDSIARVLKDHPARVRQIVSALVKAGLLKSLRGAAGGIVLAKPPSKIDLRDVYVAIGESSPLSLVMRDDDPGRNYPCNVHPVMSRMLRTMEADALSSLAGVTLDKMINRRSS
jgi:Rrf2 family protein